MQNVPSLVLAAGLAVGVLAPALADPTPPTEPTAAGRLTDLRIDATPVTLATPRGGDEYGGEFVTMRDELENYPVDTALSGMGVFAPPTSFTGPPGFVWPSNRLHGVADVSFGSGWVRVVDLSGVPAGGANGVFNTSKALRIKTIVAQSPGVFYQGASLSFGGSGTEVPTLPLEPLSGMNARVSAEHWVSSIDTRYSFETAANFVGFLTGRLLWGGECVFAEDCDESGFPFGPLLHMYALGSDPICPNCGPFTVTSYCQDVSGDPIPGCVPPPGYQPGDPVAPPIQNWFRLTNETTADGRSRFLIDHLDGSAEAAIYENILLATAYLDYVAWNASYEAQDEFMLVDNIEASGPIFQIADAPPLECPYLDDIEWLPIQYLRGQSVRWNAEYSSAARVVDDGAQGRVIRQRNSSLYTQYRREMSTQLLPSSATVSNDLIVTVRVRTTGSTVRGFALFDNEQLAARVLLGRDNGTEAPGWFTPRVYAQINPDYDPIDIFGEDPNLNIPVIGVDVTDTDVDWSTGAYRTLELRLSANGVLRVLIDGNRIYTGRGAFTSAIDAFVFESENNATGSGSQLSLNDVTLTCDAPSCAADFDLDDAVTFADLNAVLSHFGATGLSGFNPGDANGDGAINFIDLNAVLGAFGTACD